MNIAFLDFDGVVNIPYWSKDENGKFRCKYNWPHDGMVNSYQAVQWISEFCEKFNYSIVVTSTWRYDSFDCAKCLYDSGLREDVKVVGNTPIIYDVQRGDEITAYLEQHPEVENYLIFDDDSDMTVHMSRLVKCDTVVGFTLNEYKKAESLHRALRRLRKENKRKEKNI